MTTESTAFDAKELRENEIAQYEANIATYTSIVANTPSVWPEHLLKYKGSRNKHEVISQIESLDDVELLSDLWTHEDAKAAIRTETLEKRKAEAIFSTMA
jgi:hypothetical protein